MNPAPPSPGEITTPRAALDALAAALDTQPAITADCH